MAVEAATDHGRGSSDKLTSGCSVAASAAVCRAKVNTQIRTLEAKMEARTQHFVFVTGPLSRTATVASDDRFFPFPKQTSSTRFRSSSRPTQTFTAIKFLLVRQKKKTKTHRLDANAIDRRANSKSSRINRGLCFNSNESPPSLGV